MSENNKPAIKSTLHTLNVPIDTLERTWLEKNVSYVIVALNNTQD